VMSFLALAAPVAAIALVILFLWLVVRLASRRFRSANPSDNKK